MSLLACSNFDILPPTRLREFNNEKLNHRYYLDRGPMNLRPIGKVFAENMAAVEAAGYPSDSEENDDASEQYTPMATSAKSGSSLSDGYSDDSFGSEYSQSNDEKDERTAAITSGKVLRGTLGNFDHVEPAESVNTLNSPSATRARRGSAMSCLVDALSPTSLEETSKLPPSTNSNDRSRWGSADNILDDYVSDGFEEDSVETPREERAFVDVVSSFGVAQFQKFAKVRCMSIKQECDLAFCTAISTCELISNCSSMCMHGQIELSSRAAAVQARQTFESARGRRGSTLTSLLEVEPYLHIEDVEPARTKSKNAVLHSKSNKLRCTSTSVLGTIQSQHYAIVEHCHLQSTTKAVDVRTTHVEGSLQLAQFDFCEHARQTQVRPCIARIDSEFEDLATFDHVEVAAGVRSVSATAATPASVAATEKTRINHSVHKNVTEKKLTAMTACVSLDCHEFESFAVVEQTVTFHRAAAEQQSAGRKQVRFGAEEVASAAAVVTTTISNAEFADFDVVEGATSCQSPSDDTAHQILQLASTLAEFESFAHVEQTLAEQRIEAQQLAAEQEQARLAAEAEAKAQAEAERVAAKQEQARLAAEAEAKTQAEAERVAAEQEQARLAAEAEAKAQAEAERVAAEKAALAEQEQVRLAAEAADKAQAEAQRVTAEKAALAEQEQARLAAEEVASAAAVVTTTISNAEFADFDVVEEATSCQSPSDDTAHQILQLASTLAEFESFAHVEQTLAEQRIEAQQLAAEQEQARLVAEAEAKAQAEAERVAAEQEQARLAAEAEAKTQAEAERVAAEQEQARMAAETEAKAQAEAERVAAEQEQARLATKEAAKAQAEAERVAAEQEQARLAAEAEAKAQAEAERVAAEQEQARLAAEAADKAQAEAQRVAAEQAALAEQEQARLAAEEVASAAAVVTTTISNAEFADFDVVEEATSCQSPSDDTAHQILQLASTLAEFESFAHVEQTLAEQRIEAQQLAAEQEQARLVAEAEAKAQAEAERVAAEQEQARLAAEAEAKAQAEAERVAAEQEQARLAAEAEAKTQAEAERVAAEQEQARLAAEAEAKAQAEAERVAAEKAALAEQEQVRLAAEAADKAQAEAQRVAAEQAALAEQEQARLVAEEVASAAAVVTTTISNAEFADFDIVEEATSCQSPSDDTAHQILQLASTLAEFESFAHVEQTLAEQQIEAQQLAAEQEVEAKAQADAERVAAEQEQARLAAEAEAKAQAEAERVAAEQEQVRLAAEAADKAQAEAQRVAAEKAALAEQEQARLAAEEVASAAAVVTTTISNAEFADFDVVEEATSCQSPSDDTAHQILQLASTLAEFESFAHVEQTLAEQRIEAQQLAAEQEQARLAAEAEAKAQAEAERVAAKQEQARLAAEAEAKTQAEAERVAAEQEQARLAAEAEAKAQAEAERVAAEQEQVRLAAEAADKAQAEAQRVAAEQAALAKQEQARLAAEEVASAAAVVTTTISNAEFADFDVVEEATSCQSPSDDTAHQILQLASTLAEFESFAHVEQTLAEQRIEAQQLAAEQEQARLAAEAEAKAQAEAERVAAKQEQARLAAEAEAKTQAEAERVAAEQEQARLAAEAEAKAQAEAERVAAEQEQARLATKEAAKAQAEAERVAAEQEQARLASEAEAKAQAEAERVAAEQEQARLAAEAADKAQAEAQRVAAEQAALAKQEQARLAAEEVASAAAVVTTTISNAEFADFDVVEEATSCQSPSDDTAHQILQLASTLAEFESFAHVEQTLAEQQIEAQQLAAEQEPAGLAVEEETKAQAEAERVAAEQVQARLVAKEQAKVPAEAARVAAETAQDTVGAESEEFAVDNRPGESSFELQDTHAVHSLLEETENTANDSPTSHTMSLVGITCIDNADFADFDIVEEVVRSGNFKSVQVTAFQQKEFAQIKHIEKAFPSTAAIAASIDMTKISKSMFQTFCVAESVLVVDTVAAEHAIVAMDTSDEVTLDEMSAEHLSSLDDNEMDEIASKPQKAAANLMDHLAGFDLAPCANDSIQGTEIDFSSTKGSSSAHSKAEKHPSFWDLFDYVETVDRSTELSECAITPAKAPKQDPLVKVFRSFDYIEQAERLSPEPRSSDSVDIGNQNTSSLESGNATDSNSCDSDQSSENNLSTQACAASTSTTSVSSVSEPHNQIKNVPTGPRNDKAIFLGCDKFNCQQTDADEVQRPTHTQGENVQTTADNCINVSGGSAYIRRVFQNCDIRHFVRDFVHRLTSGLIPYADNEAVSVVPLEIFLSIAYQDRDSKSRASDGKAARTYQRADSDEIEQIQNKLCFDFLNEALAKIVQTHGAFAAKLSNSHLHGMVQAQHARLYRAGFASVRDLHTTATANFLNADAERRRLRGLATYVKGRFASGNSAPNIDERIDIVCGLANVIFQDIVGDTAAHMFGVL